MDDGVPPSGSGAASTPAASAAVAQSRGDVSPAASGRRGRRRANGSVRYTLGRRVTAAAATPRYERSIDDPVYRPLKIYTIDPSGRRLEGHVAEINVPFELLKPGPVGARFEVLQTPGGPLGSYPKVNLNEARLLIVNGHDPAPTDPVFHHQMLYAVAMSTYAVFRTALGREVSWGFNGKRLRLVPHAIEEANARYVRARRCLEFGYFRVGLQHASELPPDGLVFACLSHDIIAHELTHALLDGLRVRFDKGTNPDVGAFHEAFADLVAMLLRFSYQQVVRSNILRTKGDLTKDSDLLHMVLEVARGRGQEFLRKIDVKAEKKYDTAQDEYELGTVLVSAIIEAFLKIYGRKAAPYIRLATGGRDAVGENDPMPADLTESLSHVASRLASQVLAMCIRAIDYCPPIDITFGEYLRALITADRDLVPDDTYAYREALIDAFRRRRIYPVGVPSLTEDALLWHAPTRTLVEPGLNFGELRFSGDPGSVASIEEIRRQAKLIGELVSHPDNCAEFGLAMPDDPDLFGDDVDRPVVESVRSSRRVGPDGQLAFDLVAEVSQRRKIRGGDGYPEFEFFGGSTIIFGAQGDVRLVVSKCIKDLVRLTRQREFTAFAGAEVFALTSCRHETQPGPGIDRRRDEAVRRRR